MSRSGYGNNRTYTYTLPDGTQIASSRGDDAAPAISSTDDGYLYLASIDTTQTVYTYTYTDANGTVQTIGTSTGDSTNFTAATLYSRSTTDSGITRLEALKNAAATFANAVEEKAKGADGVLGTEDDISHRIAVVGFASKSGYGDNTELLSIAGSNSGSVGVAYHNITDQNLKDVLQEVDTSAGQTMVSTAIDALAASGATRTDLGLDMAQRILSANPVQPNEKRNRVVIVFTDGAPTSFNGFEKDVADNAITYAGTIKTTGATVYTIGIFAGANAVSAGTEPSGDLDQNSRSMNSACNWFMQQVSSNNGTPRTPSYYLSAADAGSLSSIFQQISDNIETGGSSSTLTEGSVVRDIISPQFTLPAGSTASDITLETYACTGKDGGTYTWRQNDTAMGATAAIDGNSVSVTGFDFSENYVGTVTDHGSVSYRGHKLVMHVGFDGFVGVFEDRIVAFRETDHHISCDQDADMFGVDLHIGVVIGRIEYDKHMFVVLFYLDYVLGSQNVFGIQVVHPEFVDDTRDRFRISQAANLEPIDAVLVDKFFE